MRALFKVQAMASVIAFLFLALASLAQSVGTSGRLAGASSGTTPEDHVSTDSGSTFIELDSWIYPALERLAAQGVIQSAFLGLRPWTRRAVYQMLGHAVQGTEASEALVQAVKKELFRDVALGSDQLDKAIFIESIYNRTQFISGIPLNDSYHFGQTLADDFGRPYGHGLQQLVGFETRAEHGRFSSLSAANTSAVRASRDTLQPSQVSSPPRITIRYKPITTSRRITSSVSWTPTHLSNSWASSSLSASRATGGDPDRPAP